LSITTQDLAYQIKVNGQIIREMRLSQKQSYALQSQVRDLLLSGGFRSGKTTVACIKLIVEHCAQPNNRILIGRLTYPELRDSTQKTFFDLLPVEMIKNWYKSEGVLKLKNGTEVLFRHLDPTSEDELKGMELGAAFIDQVEEISEDVYLTLKSRLNMLNVKNRQLIMTCNPLLFWAYKYFKQETDPTRELIEFSMLDNRHNLPEDYIADMLKRPENWKRQFVFGVWDESLLADKCVIPVEYMQGQRVFTMEPIRTFGHVKIFKDVEQGHSYQFGFDTSEGIGLDFNAMSVRDKETGEQVAFWRGQMQPDLFASTIALPTLNYFNKGFAVPEINNTGIAFVNRLKDKYTNIYHRKQFDHEENNETEALGWRTTSSTKPLLVDHYIKLLREGQIKTRANEVLAEYPTFVYTNDVSRKGMGAKQGFHDDSIIADMLACWEIEPKTFHNNNFSSTPVNFDNLIGAGKGGW